MNYLLECVRSFSLGGLVLEVLNLRVGDLVWILLVRSYWIFLSKEVIFRVINIIIVCDEVIINKYVIYMGD